MASLNHRVMLIVGNGVAGNTAAETIRKHDSGCSVVLVTDEAYPLYNRTILPHNVKLMVPDDRLFMRSFESYDRNGIEFRPATVIKTISVADRVAVTKSGDEIAYDKLLIASGGRPHRLDVPGTEGPGIFSLQYLDDSLEAKRAVADAKSAVAIGGGFIGYEFARAFGHRALHTTWLIRGPHFHHRLLDEEAGGLVDFLAREAGIEPIYGDEVAAVRRKNGKISGITTRRGLHIVADLIGCGLGLRRNVDFLEGAGVLIRQGVLTDSFLRTGAPDVFAAGDVAEFEDSTAGRHHVTGTWNSAALQARVAAANMLGGNEPFAVVPVTVNPLFHTHIRFFGMTPDLAPDLDSVRRLELQARKYRRLFFRDGRLVGAIVIGPWKGTSRARLLELITSKQRVSDRDGLLDL